jgi:hypothetical protein
MNKFERSWSLFRSSLQVIFRNKELLIFPIFISICSVVILLFFLAPAALWPTGHSPLSGDHWQALFHVFFQKTNAAGGHQITYSPVAIAYVVFLYFVSMFTATFFNVAFYNEILAALSGQPVSLGRGLRFACSRWKAILMWALFAGLIGLLIKVIEQRFEIVGRIIARIVGIAWSIAAVFAIPVIVRDEETVNPFAVLKKSAITLTQTWGESLIGYIGIGAISSIVTIGSMVMLAAGLAVSLQLRNFWLLGCCVAIWLALMVVWGYLMNVASLVYKGALYLYAAEGTIAEPYEQEMLDSAWKHKS